MRTEGSAGFLKQFPAIGQIVEQIQRSRGFALSRHAPRRYLPPMSHSASAHASAPPATAERKPVVQAEGLVRTFGGRRAVDGVSFTLQAGD